MEDYIPEHVKAYNEKYGNLVLTRCWCCEQMTITLSDFNSMRNEATLLACGYCGVIHTVHNNKICIAGVRT